METSYPTRVRTICGREESSRASWHPLSSPGTSVLLLRLSHIVGRGWQMTNNDRVFLVETSLALHCASRLCCYTFTVLLCSHVLLPPPPPLRRQHWRFTRLPSSPVTSRHLLSPPATSRPAGPPAAPTRSSWARTPRYASASPTTTRSTQTPAPSSRCAAVATSVLSSQTSAWARSGSLSSPTSPGDQHHRTQGPHRLQSGSSRPYRSRPRLPTGRSR